MSADPDASALAASLDDPGKFVPIFEHHYDEIHGFLRRRLGLELAGDVAADVFTVAFRSRRRYDAERGTVRAWLYGIANHLASEHRRAEARRRRLIELAAPAAEAIDELAIARADVDALRPVLARALACLRHDDRDALLLHAWAELSYDEVAAALDVPVGTVRSRIHRARRQLQGLIPRLIDRHASTPMEHA